MSGHLPNLEWQPIFDLVTQLTTRPTPSLIPPQHEVLTLLQAALPKYKVLQAFVGCRCKNLHHPLGVLPATVAPIRLSLAAIETPQGEVQYKCIG